MTALSDIAIRAWVKKGEAVAKSDGGGLTFTLSVGGTASWVLRYRVGGKGRELTLGRYPDLSLKEARLLALSKRAEVQQGKDVARDKQKERTRAATAFTLRELAEDYKTKKMILLAENTRRQRGSHIDKVIIPKLGALAARDISADDIVTLIRSIGESRGANVAEITFTALNEIFKHGQGQSAVTVNHCIGLSVSSIAGKPAAAKPRIQLSAAELHAILSRLPELGLENALAFRLLLITAVRNGELTRAEWAHVDFDSALWTIPAKNIKTAQGQAAKSDPDRDFIIPINPEVVGIFRELKALAGNSRWVLPARAIRKSNAGIDAHCAANSIAAILKRFCIKHAAHFRSFTPHDLRSTTRSHLTALGEPLHVKERYLNHSLGGIKGIYDKEDLQKERREAQSKLLAFYACCEAGQAWNVIDLAARRSA
jgi:integrase